MDNFHFVNVKQNIDHQEISSVKDAIFARATQKAHQLNKEKNNNYASAVKDDVMEVASNNFKSTEFNPFNQFKASLGINASQAPRPTVNPQPQPQAQADAASQLSPKYFRPLKRNIESVNANNYSASVRNETMNAAREQFRGESNLTTSLNFLKAQAAIQMANYAHSRVRHS